MSLSTAENRFPSNEKIDVWYSRCGSATASSIAIRKGWLESELSRDGILLHSLKASEDEELRNSHYHHQQTGLFRESGNIPPIWARGHGRPTAVVGITWLDEYQGILTLASSKLHDPGDLRGKRLGVPLVENLIDHQRGAALHGFATALGLTGLRLPDAVLVDLPTPWNGGIQGESQRGPRVEVEALLSGHVDAIFLRGGRGARLSRDPRFRQVININEQLDPLVRVNNGTPRPITVDRAFLERHPGVVARYLSVLLRTADWAEEHPKEVIDLLASELGAKLSPEDVIASHGSHVHRSFRPKLIGEYVRGLETQKTWLFEHGFIPNDFAIEDWIVSEPLAAAEELAKSAPVLADTPLRAVAS